MNFLSGAFLQVLNMSITATAVILAVLLLRRLLSRAPAVVCCALWAVVLFRLPGPVSFPATFSPFGRLGSFLWTARSG